MRITRFPLLALLAFVAVAGVVLALVIFFPGSVSGAAQPPAHPRPMQPASGITPKTNAAIAFSTQDVQHYVLTHEFPSGAVVPGHTIKILSIKLMTRQQADEQGHELGAYSTTKWVYVVTLEEPFYTTYVKSPVNSSQTVSEGYEVFDAHTGDTLEWGIPLRRFPAHHTSFTARELGVLYRESRFNINTGSGW